MTRLPLVTPPFQLQYLSRKRRLSHGQVWLRLTPRALLTVMLLVVVLSLAKTSTSVEKIISISLQKSALEKTNYGNGVEPMERGNTDQAESWMETCNESRNVSSLFSSLSSGEIHKMRRKMALSGTGNSSCYTRSLPSFINYTLNRIKHVRNHLNLHIPKSGGTSICSLATQKSEKYTNFTVASSNCCWEGEHFLPLWCNPRFVPGGDRSEWLDYHNEIAHPDDPSTSAAAAALCNVMDRKLPMFVMNENYITILCAHSTDYTP